MSNTVKLIIIIILGILVLGAGALYLIRPSLNQIRDLNTQLKEKLSESKTLNQQIIAFQTAESDLKKASQKERVNGVIVDREELVNPILYFEKAAAVTGVIFNISIIDDQAAAKVTSKNIPTEVVAGKKGSREISYTLTLKAANYSQLINFLMMLENTPNFTHIYEFELGSSITEGGQNQLEQQTPTGEIIGKLNGVFFVVGDPPAPTTKTAAKPKKDEVTE